MSYEPTIVPGDSGEYVTLLQERLQQLGYYEGTVDGYYGPTTETAVDQFQEAAGVERVAQVQEATWQAIEQYGGVEEETVAADTAGERELSEDGQWWWDGADWQAVEEQVAADTDTVEADTVEAEAVQLSEDGQWQWDGVQWLPAGGAISSPGLTTSSTDDALTGFETGLADLTPEHMQILDGIVEDLNAHPLLGGYVTLTGGSDRRGDATMNKELGQRRANAVRDYLQSRITDDETRQEIRAYSLGEPTEGPEVDDPSQRRVDIVITRRSIPIEKPKPTEPLPKMGEKPWTDLDEWLKKNKPPIDPGDPDEPKWPDWFWKELPPKPPRPDFITELSQWLNKVLGTRDLARLAADIAGRLGFNEAEVRRALEDAFQKGGEEGVKKLLRMLIDKFNETQRGAPGTPQGPPDPIPFPDPDAKTPKVEF